MKPQYAIEIDEFHGQASAIPNSDLKVGKRGAYGKKCSLLIGRDLRASSENMGTGEYIMKPGGYVLASHEWNAYDGNRYTMLYLSTGGTCYLKYYVNDPATVDTAPTALTFYDDANPPAALSPQPTMPVWTVPGFARDAAGQLYVALGPAGVYRIVAQNKTLYAYLTNIPLTHFITFDNLRAWTHPGDVPDQTWSAIGDPTRYFPLPDEMAANPPTYGVDYHYQLAGLGVKGSQVVGETIFGRAKVTWTLDDCFAVFGTGNDGETQAGKIGDGYGLAGFRAFDEFYETLYWFSKKNGGMWVGMTFGRVPKGSRLLETITLGSDYQVSLFDAGWMIADVFQAAPKMTSVLKRVSWGEQQEWAAIPAAQRANLEIGDRPGWIYLKGSNALTYTVSDAILEWRPTNALDTLDNYGEVGAKSYLNDEQNTYPNGTPETEWTFRINLKTGLKFNVPNPTVYLYYLDGMGTWQRLLDKNTGSNKLNFISGWQSITFDPINTSQIKIVFYATWRTTAAQSYELGVNYVFDFGASKQVTAFRLYDLLHTCTMGVPGQDGYLKCKEIIIEGGQNATATLYTECPTATSKAVFTGLTPSSAADFGIFWARWYGHGVTYDSGMQIWIRAGTAALSTYDQASPATWSNWTEITGNHLKRGYALKNLTFSGGGALKASSGGLLYVQVKVTFTLSATGQTAYLNYLLFTCYGGSNLTSCFPAGHDADRVFCCLMHNSSSAGPDREVSRNVLGKWSVIDNKKVRSYMQRGDGAPLAFMGYKGAPQYSGQHNYQGTSDDDVELLAEFQSPDLIGDDMLGLNLETLIGRYIPGGTKVATLTNTKFNATTALIKDGQTALSAGFPQKQLVKNKDGYLYYLHTATRPGDVKLYLSRINPATGAVLETWTIENRTQSLYYFGFSMVEDATGDNLLIAWMRYVSGDTVYSHRQRLSFAKFNIAAETLDIDTDIYTPASSIFYAYPSIAVAGNGDIYIAFLRQNSGTSDYSLRLLRSLDGGTSWTLAATIAAPTATWYQPFLDKTPEGRLCMVYGTGSAALYFREVPNGIAGDEITVESGVNNTSGFLASTPSSLYLIANTTVAASAIKIYRYDGGSFTLVKTQAASTARKPAAVALADGNLFVAYVASGGTQFVCLIGHDQSWATEAALLTSDVTIGDHQLAVVRRGDNTLYLVSKYTDGTAGYRTFKTVTSALEGSYPLEVKVVSERNTKHAWNSAREITSTKRIPRSMTMPRMGRRRQIGVHVCGYGILDLERIAFNAGQG